MPIEIPGTSEIYKEVRFMTMTWLGFLVLIVIAAIVGSIGQALVGFSRGGCLVSAVVGFIGAYLGIWLSRELGLPELLTVNIDGEPFPIIWSIIGSAILAAVLSLISGRRRVFR
jgi:uncharacterized membrane protein YeaQ/YmgE (transglycosylase-associated protein family)